MKAFHHIEVILGDPLKLLLPRALVETLGLHASRTGLGLRGRRHRGTLPVRDLQQVLYQLRIVLTDLILTLYYHTC